MSGRAMMAVGEAALRGIETLAIRRKLRVLNSVFPHKDTVLFRTIEDFAAVYYDVIELSRYDNIFNASFCWQ